VLQQQHLVQQPQLLYQQPLLHHVPPVQSQQQAWQLEAMLGGRDAELIALKHCMQELELHNETLNASQAAAALQLASLTERIACMEKACAHNAPVAVTAVQHTTAAPIPACAADLASQGAAPPSEDAACTAMGSAVARVAEAWAAGVVGAVGVSDSLRQQDVVTAIEGLAADATQANIRLAGLEEGVQQQDARLEQLEGHNQHLSQQLHQVSE
jgi:hypothetical protein